MKKLNNHGWGLSTLIAFIAVFCIAIILIIIGAINLGISSKDDVSKLPVTDTTIDNNSNNNSNGTDEEEDTYMLQFENYKQQLVDVSKNYVKNGNSVAESDSLTVTVVSLVNQNYINKLEINGYTCTGYVTIINNSNKLEYKPYINCGNGYITEAYNSDIDESFKN